MLIVTARIPRRRLMAGGVSVLCCCLVLVVALVLSLNGGAVPTSASVSGMEDNSARVTYLQQRGWTVGDQAVSTQELLIPDTLDESYDSYQTLQRQQGFDLENYCGQRVQRYVYPISNHPTGRSDVQAVLLVCDGTLIGGHIQAADGSFVSTLDFPAASASPSATSSPAPSATPSPAPSPAASATI